MVERVSSLVSAATCELFSHVLSNACWNVYAFLDEFMNVYAFLDQFMNASWFFYPAVGLYSVTSQYKITLSARFSNLHNSWTFIDWHDLFGAQGTARVFLPLFKE